MLKVTEKHYRVAMLGVLGIVAITILLTFRHYGITWDEELQSQYGLAIVDYYTSLFADQRYAEIFNLYLYGGMFDGLASVIDRFTPFSVYETRHLVNALFGLLGLWGTWRLGRFLGGGAVGLTALILLVLTPMYYGHMFNNPKDIPFATGIVWTMFYMAKSIADFPKIRDRTIAMIGLVLGLTLGVRVGGAMTILFWIVALKGRVWQPYLTAKPWWKKIVPLKKNFPLWRKVLAAHWRCGWRLILPALLIAYVVMLACWPWAQQSPILNPIHAFNEFRHFPQDVEVQLDGKTYRSTELPWYYVPLYFGVQLPELLLLLLAAGVFFMPLIWRSLEEPKQSALILVLLTGFAPIFYSTVGHPALYDAVRHFLFTVPLMCVFAALAARAAFAWAVGNFRRCWSRHLIAAGLFTVFIMASTTQLALMIALHPYEYIYINQFGGGVAGAFGRYELDYWGSSFKEAAKQLQAYVAKHGGVPPGKIYRVAICGPWDAAMIYLPPDYEPVIANEPADFFLSTTRWMCQNMRPGKTIVRITRLGVPLSVVKDVQGQ
jgi:hypothetical protein